MPALYIVSLLVSVGMILHCVRTGRNRIWILVMLILLSLPFVGAAIYAAAEILPELLRTRTSRRALRGVRDTIDPERDLRRLENEMKVSGTAATRQRYADELVRLERPAEAVALYQSILTGVFAEDPKFLLGYAQALFAAGDAPRARAVLDELIGKNPEFKSPEGHLLYARALEGEGDVEKALVEYATLAGYYPGAEAGVRYAKLLNLSGQRPLARQTLEALLDGAKLAPAHYRRAQSEWLDEAQKELRGA